MSDIRTAMIPAQEAGQAPSFDWFQVDPSLAEDDGLESAVIISLFTDRLASESDILPDDSDDMRGWWGDAYAAIENDNIGSLLWLLSREKELLSVVQKARQYARDSLQWLLDDGVVQSVEVEAGWVDGISGELTPAKGANSLPGVMGINVTIQRPQHPANQFQFQTFWSTQ